MNDADKTPVDGRSTVEIFADDMRATKLAAQNTETIQLRMYEEFKEHRQDVQKLQRQQDEDRRRAWLPAIVAVAAALVSAACAFAAIQ